MLARLPWFQPRIVLRCADPAAVAATAIARVGGPPVLRLDVRVRTWERPAGWIGSPALPAVRSLRVTSRAGGGRVRIRLGRPMDPGLALAGVLRVLRPTLAPVIGPQLAFAPGVPPCAAALAGELVDIADGRHDAHLRLHDIVVAGEGSPVLRESSSAVITVRREDWPVDLRVHNPIGRDVQSLAPPSVRDIEPTPDGSWALRGTPIRLGASLTASDVRALRGVTGVRIDRAWRADPRVGQLHASGLHVVDADARADVPDDAFTGHALQAQERRWAMRSGSANGVLERWPSVTAVLLTHRADFLDQIAGQLAALAYPRLEILIGLHGMAESVHEQALSCLAAAGEQRARVIAVDAHLPFGSALQFLSTHAGGELLTKIDDDDGYGPEHVWDLVLARLWSGATIVGKALDWIHVRSADCTVYRPVYRAETYATFVAGGALMISAGDLRELGGWRPVPKSVDRALLDQARSHGALVYRTSGLGYLYVRHTGQHTAKVRDEHFLSRTAARWPGRLAHPALAAHGPMVVQPPMSGTDTSGQP